MSLEISAIKRRTTLFNSTFDSHFVQRTVNTPQKQNMKTLVIVSLCLVAVSQSASLERERRFADGVGLVIKKSNFKSVPPPSAAIPVAAIPVPPPKPAVVSARVSVMKPMAAAAAPVMPATAAFSPLPSPAFVARQPLPAPMVAQPPPQSAIFAMPPFARPIPASSATIKLGKFKL